MNSNARNYQFILRENSKNRQICQGKVEFSELCYLATTYNGITRNTIF